MPAGVLTEAILKFGRLRHTYVIVGWVPTDSIGDLTGKGPTGIQGNDH